MNKKKVLEVCDNVLFFLYMTFHNSKVLRDKNVLKYIFISFSF